MSIVHRPISETAHLRGVQQPLESAVRSMGAASESVGTQVLHAGVARACIAHAAAERAGCSPADFGDCFPNGHKTTEVLATVSKSGAPRAGKWANRQNSYLGDKTVCGQSP